MCIRDSGAKSGAICRTVKDIKELKEESVQNRRDLEQRITGSDMAYTEITTRLYEKIDAVDNRTIEKIDAVDNKKMNSRTFVLIIAIFGGMVLASVGFNWAIQTKSSNKMTEIVEKHSTENRAATKEVVIAMNNMALNVGGLQKDITNLSKNFDEYKRWNETEHQIFRQSITPNTWRSNGTIK